MKRRKFTVRLQVFEKEKHISNIDLEVSSVSSFEASVDAVWKAKLLNLGPNLKYGVGSVKRVEKPAVYESVLIREDSGLGPSARR